MAVDKVKGTADIPYTLNNYVYCWNNSLLFVDNDGKLPTYTTGEMSTTVLIEATLKYLDKHPMTLGIGMSGGVSIPFVGAEVGIKYYLDTSGNTDVLVSGAYNLGLEVDAHFNFLDISILLGCSNVKDVEGFGVNIGLRVVLVLMRELI